MLNNSEYMDHIPKVVYMDSNNRIIGKKADGG
jgi:aspartate 1-decarboxylase